MSPLLLIVCAPVLVGCAAFLALLLGGAAAGTWEVIEARREAPPPVRWSVTAQSEPSEPPSVARAA